MLLAVCIGYLPYRFYGPEGVARALRLETDLQRLREGNERLQRDNQLLRQQIHRLKGDRSFIEQVARDELGMVRPEDLLFHIQW